MSKDHWKLGAAELASAYRNTSLTPMDVVLELRNRIDVLDTDINAYVAISDDLEEQAAESSYRLNAKKPRSVLEGVTVAIKDNLVMAGLPASWGSAAFAGQTCTKDELPIRRLREAGAILVGKTNCPEFAVEGYTSNATFGSSGNPWNPLLTPGGSSGGTVSAVATGLAAVGIGTDGGGSIRRPAGYTGLFGMKPGIGTNARADGLPQLLMDFEVVGPIARSVKDLRMVQDVLSGADRADPLSRISLHSQQNEMRPLRILNVVSFGDSPCDSGIRNSTLQFSEKLRALGHEIIEGSLPLDLDGISEFWGKFSQIGLAYLRQERPEIVSGAAAPYMAMADAGELVPAKDLFGAIQKVAKLRAEMSLLMSQWDIVMTPTAAAQPWPRATPFPDKIDGKKVEPRGHAIYTAWVNVVGHPAIAVPADSDSAGMPVGVQLIGDLGAEEFLMNLAEQIEASTSSWRWPPYALA